MEEPETPDPEFIKGFNEGYTMSCYMPKLAESIGKAAGDSQRSIGFQKGREQSSLERRLDRQPAWLSERKSEENRKDRGKSMDRDIEPSR